MVMISQKTSAAYLSHPEPKGQHRPSRMSAITVAVALSTASFLVACAPSPEQQQQAAEARAATAAAEQKAAEAERAAAEAKLKAQQAQQQLTAATPAAPPEEKTAGQRCVEGAGSAAGVATVGTLAICVVDVFLTAGASGVCAATVATATANAPYAMAAGCAVNATMPPDSARVGTQATQQVSNPNDPAIAQGGATIPGAAPDPTRPDNDQETRVQPRP